MNFLILFLWIILAKNLFIKMKKVVNVTSIEYGTITVDVAENADSGKAKVVSIEQYRAG